MLEKSYASPDFPNYWLKISQSGLTNIVSHLKLLGFQDVYMAYFGKFSWL